ncbi:MAG: hypothetical protein QOF51_335 [Chloroflexota bacterium]|jgi:hypothetical protein|nr:hypothetical protein [Chloroflexota bacterium]
MKVEWISADEQVYHERIHGLYEQIAYAWTHWGDYLAEKYGLGADDRITPDGEIHRTEEEVRGGEA